MAGREHALRLEPAEDIRAVRLACGASDIGDNVVAQRVVPDRAVVSDVERSVAVLVPDLERFNADALSGHADPGIARSNQVLVNLVPVDVEIVP